MKQDTKWHDRQEPDYVHRSWALGHAIEANKKGTKPERIINDARKYYRFMFPENGKVKKVNNVR